MPHPPCDFYSAMGSTRRAQQHLISIVASEGYGAKKHEYLCNEHFAVIVRSTDRRYEVIPLPAAKPKKRKRKNGDQMDMGF